MMKVLLILATAGLFSLTQTVNMGNAEQLFDHADDVSAKYFEQPEPYWKQVAPLLPDTEKAIECMALNIYHEARSEGVDSQYAVAWVTYNRVKSDRFPNTVCEVVYQGRISKWHIENTGKIVPLRHKCQFSWYCDGKSDAIYEREEYEEARKIAIDVLLDHRISDPTLGSLWYHADYVDPYWSKDYDRVAQIGTHIFYREN